MAHAYTSLSRAQLSYDYLHTNSTSHEFLFGALAEIVDNSRDAAANNLEIYTVPDRTLRGCTMLCFLDDGEGMDPVETANVITFGLSQKKAMDSTQIGQYGNGLKSASMRIANDLIVFTKKGDFMTCLMLCRTFHEEEHIKEVIVPLPSFHVDSLEPNCVAKGKGKGKEKEKHELEMNLILKYSPFHTREDFFKQFHRLPKTGTLVILYNLKLLDNGLTELDFKTDTEDILITGIDLALEKNLVPERYSFRAYVSMLYSEPKMKVYVQQKKVRPVRLVYNLYKPRSYQYTSARFKARSKEEAKKADLEYKATKQRFIEAEGRAREMENTTTNLSKSDRVKLRNLHTAIEELRVETKNKEIISEKKQRSLKEPKTLSFIFGIHLGNRKCDGLFIYNCHRLIKMYERVGPQYQSNTKCRGVVGIVNVPYLVLEPTLNKQDFTDAKEYRHLLKVLGEHMEHYWKDVDLGNHTINEFWEDYGYQSEDWEEMPSKDMKFVGRRARETKICIQCDKCLKWRVLPYSSSDVGKVFPDNWVCSMNPDTSRNKCANLEEKLNLPEGKFQKVEKSREERDAEVAEQMKKLEEKRNKQSQREVVTSSKAAKTIMAEVSQRRAESSRPAEPIMRTPEIRSRTPEIRSRVSETVPKPSETPRRYSDVTKRVLVREEREIPAVKRKRVNRTRVSTDSANDDDVVADLVPYSRPQRRSTRSSYEDTTNSCDSTFTNMDEWWPELSDEELETPTIIDVGSRVELNIRDKWHIGTALRKNGSDLIVRLDKLPFAKFDKRISPQNDKIRLAVMPESTKIQQEMPSSSTTSNGPFTADDQISRNLRTCLHFFMPPKWSMDKDKIQSLSKDELLSFPLDDFFKKYEDGLRNLIAGFQEEAWAKAKEAETLKKEAEEARKKLKHTNQLIARLLNSIHEECNLDPETDSDKVDELLQACVAQAEMPFSQADQVSTSCL